MLPMNGPLSATLPRDLTAGVVVFLVALPLCLGVALASGCAVVLGRAGRHRRRHSGGRAERVAHQRQRPGGRPDGGRGRADRALGSFEAFLLAVVLAGLIQIGLGLARAGFIAAFFPSSVIKGLLAAIGVILILKQIPHVLGHDTDPEGEMAFQQPDHENTFSELARTARRHPPRRGRDRPGCRSRCWSSGTS